MTLLEDVKQADWTDPGQWKHACGFVACKALHGKHCHHIPGLGTFTENWPEVMLIPYLGGPALLGFAAGWFVRSRR
jgi:hypothetical protein